METVAEILEHSGVMGMKWGVRRSSGGDSRGPTDVVLKAKSRSRVTATGGKGHPASEEARTTATINQKARASGVHSLSNKELQSAVTRMNLEQQYSGLTHKVKQKSVGRKFIKNSFKTIKTANEVVAFANSPIGKIIQKQFSSA